MVKPRKIESIKVAKAYEHAEKGVLRPEVGLQTEFKQKRPPAKYRYDPSLDPELSWDINADRERGEALIQKIRGATTLEEARAAAEELARMSRPFLNWAGKAERREFEVPTLPLFVHERLSTKAILESLKGHRPQQTLDLFGDSGLDIADRVLKAYEHPAPWTNRLILGDSLLVMNSLLQYEGLGGQVQMIYMDPPYGVKFGSNFQPFVRKREVRHGDDEAVSREPETIQAYRDTWELGTHSYLTYLRDRLLTCHELLSPSGSLFLQISEENTHHVREILDDLFGSENFVSEVAFSKTSGKGGAGLDSVWDRLLWYAKDKSLMKYRPLYKPKGAHTLEEQYTMVELPNGDVRQMTKDELDGTSPFPGGGRRFMADTLSSQSGGGTTSFEYEFQGKKYSPPANAFWKTNMEGMKSLEQANRLLAIGNRLRYKRYVDDFPVVPFTNFWDDTVISGFSEPKIFVVQTSPKVVERCALMTTDPGDLVLDPTCGGGTTAYVAESWGRRWITIDTSRVPLALVRQRLLTATCPYYVLRDAGKGPSGGFAYTRRKNRKDEQVGGILPHVTLRSIAHGEQPEEEVLVDRPEIEEDVTRVCGTFTVEAVTPPSTHLVSETQADPQVQARSPAEHVDRVVGALTRAQSLRLPGGGVVDLRNVRRTTRSVDLHAEAETGPTDDPQPVAVVIGPPDGPVTETLVHLAAREANMKGYAHLYVVGFAIEDAATKLIRSAVTRIPASYVNASLDILMGDGGWDLLKTTRSSEIFSITGEPEAQLVRLKGEGANGEDLYQVHLLGVDVFDPVAMEVHHKKGDDVPAWLLDTDYNELAFWVTQAFFPKTGAWDNLKRELKGVYRDEVWNHLAGTTSAPFPAGKHKRIAVKVIDERGNELLVVKNLSEAEDV